MLPLGIAGAALQLGSGLFASRSARKAAQQREAQARARQAQIQQYGQGALERSQALTNELPTGFRAWNIKTGLGNWSVDPTTGQATAQMSPEAAAQQQRLYGASNTAWNQLGNFDRQQFAQQEFNRGQGLLQEGRNADLSNLLGMLQRKGLAGFGQTAVGGTSTVETNPLLNSLFDRRNRQDLELMDRSFGAADTQLDRLSNRATDFFNRGYGMNDDLNNQLETGLRLGEQERQRALTDWQNRYRAFGDNEQYRKIAELGGMEEVMSAQDLGLQARLSGNTGLARSVDNIGGMMMQGKFPSIGSAPSGMFSNMTGSDVGYGAGYLDNYLDPMAFNAPTGYFSR